MYQSQYDYDDSHRHESGQVRIRGGEWKEDVCHFDFEIEPRGLRGKVFCDWREESPRFSLQHGKFDERGDMAFFRSMSECLRGFHSRGFAELSDAARSEFYAGSYHRQNNYAVGSDLEAQRKGRLAQLTCELTAPRKVLVAGCSAGETVRQLRARSVEAWGFDLCPDLERIAYPKLREWLRVGDASEIPFGPLDGFDVLTAFDLFEHVPEAGVPAMVLEFERLGIRDIVALIAHCEFAYEGHITLRPLCWWDRAFAPRFRRLRGEELRIARPHVLPIGGDESGVLRVYRSTR